MSHPYVTKVTLLDGQIMLTLVFDKSMAGLSFELSGYATQNGGAFANFYDVKTPTAAPDKTVVAYIETAPLRPFKNGEDVTVVLRAARVWATVLRQPEDAPPPGIAPHAWVGTPAPVGATWNDIRELAWVPSVGLHGWNAVQAAAGDANQAAAGDANRAAAGDANWAAAGDANFPGR
jgi:hypothetical protein